MNKSETKALLKKYHLAPNKLLGQNFLIDRGALAKIIAAAELTADDTILEVGPGLGVLTQELAKHAKRVMAVEKDKQLTEVLRNILREEGILNVEVIEGDILKIFNFKFQISNQFLISELNNSKFNQNSKFKIQNYKLVANIPYYLTSRLIRTFLESANPPSLMVLMLQKEVARRIAAQPPQMSLLAVATQLYADVKIVATVPKQSFWPAPKVDSAIIKITPRLSSPLSQRGGRAKSPEGASPLFVGDLKTSPQNQIHPGPPLQKEGASSFSARDDNTQFFRILHAGFSQPRKQLAGNLHQALNTDKAEIEKRLNQLNLKNSVRAQELAVGDWIKLAKYFQNGL